MIIYERPLPDWNPSGQANSLQTDSQSNLAVATLK